MNSKDLGDTNNTDSAVVKNILLSPDIQRFKLLTIIKGIELEGMGLKKRGRSCLSIAKSHYNIKGSRLNILKQLNDKLEETKHHGNGDKK